MSEEIQIFEIALRACGVKMSPELIDAFLMIKKQYDKKGAKFDMKDTSVIKAKLQEKYGRRTVYHQIEIGTN